MQGLPAPFPWICLGRRPRRGTSALILKNPRVSVTTDVGGEQRPSQQGLWLLRNRSPGFPILSKSRKTQKSTFESIISFLLLFFLFWAGDETQVFTRETSTLPLSYILAPNTQVCVILVFFLWCWGRSPGPLACSAHAAPLSCARPTLLLNTVPGGKGRQASGGFKMT